MVVLIGEERCIYGCPERKVVRSRRRVLRTCNAMAKQAHSRVRKARIEMASNRCMQLAKDTKVGCAGGCRAVSDIFADAHWPVQL